MSDNHHATAESVSGAISHWRKALVLIATLMANMIAFAVIAPLIGMGTAFLGFAWLIVALASVGMALSRWTGLHRALVALITVVVVFSILRLESRAIRAYMFRYPPKRPIFRNDFSDYDRSLMPIWQRESLELDDHNQFAVADFDSNMILVVARGALRGSIPISIFQDRVQVFNDNSVLLLNEQPTPGVMVIVLPDGRVGRFPLAPGRARWFGDGMAFYEEPDYMDRARQALVASVQAKLDAFLVGYERLEPPAEESAVP